MSKDHSDDLDLLLSLQDRILETPPASPHSQKSGYNSDDESLTRPREADMSFFRDAVKDYLTNEDHGTAKAVSKPKPPKHSKEIDFDRFSGLRIRNLLMSNADLNNCFADIRFLRLPAIRHSLVGDTISGRWATVGVLIEKGNKKTSAAGKTFCIWKFGCLDEVTVSVFLFGDAYTKHWKESAGTVFALFNSHVRKNAKVNGFTLNVYSADQIVKMGISADYGVCKGKRKDGMSCTMVINKRLGMFCKYHNSKESQKYSTSRTELKGGKFKTAFRNSLKTEGIHLFDPLSDRTNTSKLVKPVKVLSVEGMKKALSNAATVTTNDRSQGIRFLAEVAEKRQSLDPSREPLKPKCQNQCTSGSEKRSFSAMAIASRIVIPDQPHPGAKRTKIHVDSSNLMELDIVSSDEDM